MNAPKDFEWLDGRELAVKCPTCNTTYVPAHVDPVSGETWGGIPKACKVCRRERAEEKRKALPFNPDLVKAVIAHARDNYDRDGWDYVIEAYTEKEIWEAIAGSKDSVEAVRKMRKVTRLLAERRSEIESTVW